MEFFCNYTAGGPRKLVLSSSVYELLITGSELLKTVAERKTL